MNLMSKLNHPNIVKFIAGWYNRKNKRLSFWKSKNN